LFEPHIDKEKYQKKFVQALEGLAAIIDSVPEEWLNEIPDALGEIERSRVV
jgi:hypothetical protein